MAAKTSWVPNPQLLRSPVIAMINSVCTRLTEVLRAAFAVALTLMLVAGAFPALAADEEANAEDGNSFWGYVPAPPKLKLPSIDRIVPFWTDDVKKAQKAYNKGDYGRAHRFFSRASDDGNAVADWFLGHMYRLGRGVERDHAIAYSYYQRVAEAYDPDDEDANRLRIAIDSQLHMANYIRIGVPSAGIKPEPGRAARVYLRLASAYGHPGAQFALGEMYLEGNGVKKNHQQAMKWLTAAARKRHAGAQALLGDLYWGGKGVKKDHTRALMWYTLAAETAKPAEDLLIIERYNELKSELADDERLEAEARARVYAEQYPASLASRD
jgi:uncharacterized protein